MSALRSTVEGRRTLVGFVEEPLGLHFEVPALRNAVCSQGDTLQWVQNWLHQRPRRPHSLANTTCPALQGIPQHAWQKRRPNFDAGGLYSRAFGRVLEHDRLLQDHEATLLCVGLRLLIQARQGSSIVDQQVFARQGPEHDIEQVGDPEQFWFKNTIGQRWPEQTWQATSRPVTGQKFIVDALGEWHLQQDERKCNEGPKFADFSEQHDAERSTSQPEGRLTGQQLNCKHCAKRVPGINRSLKFSQVAQLWPRQHCQVGNSKCQERWKLCDYIDKWHWAIWAALNICKACEQKHHPPLRQAAWRVPPRNVILKRNHSIRSNDSRHSWLND